MRIDRSKLLKKARKLLDEVKQKSNPNGWEIRFEIVEDYKIEDQAYALLVYVKPHQGEDLQIYQHLQEISLINAAEFLVNEKSKPSGNDLWTKGTQLFTCNFGETFSLGVAFREFDSKRTNEPHISDQNQDAH